MQVNIDALPKTHKIEFEPVTSEPQTPATPEELSAPSEEPTLNPELETAEDVDSEKASTIDTAFTPEERAEAAGEAKKAMEARLDKGFDALSKAITGKSLKEINQEETECGVDLKEEKESLEEHQAHCATCQALNVNDPLSIEAFDKMMQELEEKSGVTLHAEFPNDYSKDSEGRIQRTPVIVTDSPTSTAALKKSLQMRLLEVTIEEKVIVNLLKNL